MSWRCANCYESDRTCLCVNRDGTARFPANWERLVKRQPDPLIYALSRADQPGLSVSGRVWRAGVGESVIEAITRIQMARAGALVLVWDEKRRFAAVETSLPFPETEQTRGDDYRLLLRSVRRAYRFAVSRIKLAVGSDLAPSTDAAKWERYVGKGRQAGEREGSVGVLSESGRRTRKPASDSRRLTETKDAVGRVSRGARR